jgi:hypothetical protein
VSHAVVLCRQSAVDAVLESALLPVAPALRPAVTDGLPAMVTPRVTGITTVEVPPLGIVTAPLVIALAAPGGLAVTRALFGPLGAALPAFTAPIDGRIIARPVLATGLALLRPAFALFSFAGLPVGLGRALGALVAIDPATNGTLGHHRSRHAERTGGQQRQHDLRVFHWMSPLHSNGPGLDPRLDCWRD